MANDVKAFFHEWCAKTKVDPAFESRATGKYSNQPHSTKIDFIITTHVLCFLKYNSNTNIRLRP